MISIQKQKLASTKNKKGPKDYGSMLYNIATTLDKNTQWVKEQKLTPFKAQSTCTWQTTNYDADSIKYMASAREIGD